MLHGVLTYMMGFIPKLLVLPGVVLHLLFHVELPRPRPLVNRVEVPA